MNKLLSFATVAAVALTGPSAFAQTAQQQGSQGDRIGAIFRTLFGDRQGVTTSIEAQWAAGQTPLANQRGQFESRVDMDVRSGALSQATAARLRADYAALVQLESRYGADGRFTTQERTELADRYGDLTQILATGNAYPSTGGAAVSAVADGRTAFEQRVNAAVTARRLTRVQGTRLKADYAAVVQLEADYLRDGVISSREQEELDSRLDDLDARVDGTAAGLPQLTARQRLDAVLRALPSSGLTAASQAQLRVEHGDLLRLEAAYGQLNPTADDRAYLERRLVDLETRARVRR
jgi:chromosome segregation ATPase